MTETDLPGAPQSGEVLQVTVTLSVRVIDPERLAAAARRSLQGAHFSDSASRDAALAEVSRNASAALEEVIDAAQLLDGVDGVAVVGELLAVTPAEPRAAADPTRSFSSAHGSPLTERTAAILHTALLGLSRTGGEQLRGLAGEPITSDQDGGLFAMLPSFTWSQDAGWRSRFLRAVDALAEDLSAATLPVPRTPAEEMALELGIVYAERLLRGNPGQVAQAVGSLPASPHDYDWIACRDHLFQDGDLLLILQPGADGLENPESELNRELGIGDYRPQAWFSAFGNVEPRSRPATN
jgi:hypothetical protein